MIFFFKQPAFASSLSDTTSHLKSTLWHIFALWSHWSGARGFATTDYVSLFVLWERALPWPSPWPVCLAGLKKTERPTASILQERPAVEAEQAGLQSVVLQLNLSCQFFSLAHLELQRRRHGDSISCFDGWVLRRFVPALQGGSRRKPQPSLHAKLSVVCIIARRRTVFVVMMRQFTI